MSKTEFLYSRTDKPINKEVVSVMDTTILFLVGGKGTRVRDITNNDIPKPLIEITDDLKLIDLICINLLEMGFGNFTFCVGHHSTLIEDHISQNNWQSRNAEKKIYISNEESEGLLGPAGAAYKAIQSQQLEGPVLMIPGDMFLPWANFKGMIANHVQNSADITFGVTSVVTERTTDVGKILTDRTSGKLIKCYGRDEAVPEPNVDVVPLTSAGLVVVDAKRFSYLYASYVNEANIQPNTSVSIRDNILQWAMQDSNNRIYTYDVAGEALDIGTPSNVIYAREKWREYMISAEMLYE